LTDQHGNQLKNFSVKKFIKAGNAKSIYGETKSIEITAVCDSLDIELNCKIYLPNKFDNALICITSIKNRGKKEIDLAGYSVVNFLLDAKNFDADSSYKFWSFQGGSYEERYDWIFPLTKDFKRDNYQGMNADDYGGGMPIVDLWTKQQGITFASLAKVPEFISLPVRAAADSGVFFNMSKNEVIKLLPRKSYSMVPFTIIFHNGDYYNGLKTYSNLMRKGGMRFYTSPKSAYQPEWCAWGYERNFKPSDILGTLDKVKSLGLGWVTIDDGWQNNIGDWVPDRKKFPAGDKDFKSLIDSIHAKGLKVRIWWVPLTAQDSSYSAKYYPNEMKHYGFSAQTKVASEHPDWFLLDKNGSRVKVSWWNSYYFCPAKKEVVNYYESFVRKAILEWGVDGFKIDGQNFNAVPECFNEQHHHKNAVSSSQSLPKYFQKINDLAIKLNPNFVIQMCPCGTNFSIYNLPYVNQLVASDPLSSWQVRLKGKTFKALLGNKVAYSGDHVELTNHIWHEELQKSIPSGKEDFASTLAVGGVPSTKFTTEGIRQSDSTLELDTLKQIYYRRWIEIYNKEKMSKGEYLNLYDIGFDKPESHLIKKGESNYYSFFVDKSFNGKVEIKGLGKGDYKVYDLFSGKFISNINSANPFLAISFDHYLILKVIRGNN
jgi:alpha-galactosidase